jgi:hypothetical protein
MFKALPAWIEILVCDFLWRQTAGKIEWEIEIDIMMQHMVVIKDEECFKTMTKKFTQRNAKYF